MAAHFGISIAIVMPFAIAVGLASLPAIIAKDNGGTALVLIPIVLIIILIFPFLYAVNWVSLAHKRLTLAILDNRKPTFKEIFKHDSKKIFGLIGLSFLTGLAVLGGYLLLIIPGIILLIMFSYAPFIYVKKDIGVIDAMGESFALVKSSWQELLGVGSIFLLYRALAQGISNIPILGALFSMVFLPIDVFVAYWQDVATGYRYTSAASGAPRPKVDSLNWVFIGLVIGLVVLTILVVVGIIVFAVINAANEPVPCGCLPPNLNPAI